MLSEALERTGAAAVVDVADVDVDLAVVPLVATEDVPGEAFDLVALVVHVDLERLGREGHLEHAGVLRAGQHEAGVRVNDRHCREVLAAVQVVVLVRGDREDVARREVGGHHGRLERRHAFVVLVLLAQHHRRALDRHQAGRVGRVTAQDGDGPAGERIATTVVGRDGGAADAHVDVQVEDVGVVEHRRRIGARHRVHRRLRVPGHGLRAAARSHEVVVRGDRHVHCVIARARTRDTDHGGAVVAGHAAADLGLAVRVREELDGGAGDPGMPR